MCSVRSGSGEEPAESVPAPGHAARISVCLEPRKPLLTITWIRSSSLVCGSCICDRQKVTRGLQHHSVIDTGVSFRATLYVEMAVKPTPRNRRLCTLSDGRSSQARVGATGERSVATQLGDDACQCTCVCLCCCCVQCNILAGSRIPLSDRMLPLPSAVSHLFVCSSDRRCERCANVGCIRSRLGKQHSADYSVHFRCCTHCQVQRGLRDPSRTAHYRHVVCLAPGRHRPESSREPIRVRRVRERLKLHGTAIRTT